MYICGFWFGGCIIMRAENCVFSYDCLLGCVCAILSVKKTRPFISMTQVGLKFLVILPICHTVKRWLNALRNIFLQKKSCKRLSYNKIFLTLHPVSGTHALGGQYLRYHPKITQPQLLKPDGEAIKGPPNFYYTQETTRKQCLRFVKLQERRP